MEHTPPHKVLNQPPPLEDLLAVREDAALCEGLAREGGGAFETEARAFGRAVGRAETFALGRQASRFTPELRTHDRFGNRDDVAFHPAWHAVMRLVARGRQFEAAASSDAIGWRDRSDRTAHSGGRQRMCTRFSPKRLASSTSFPR